LLTSLQRLPSVRSVAGAAEAAAAGATIIAKALHAGFFGVYQAATLSGFHFTDSDRWRDRTQRNRPKRIRMGDFDNWRGNGDSDLCIPCVFPVKTEEGIMIFGTFAVI